MHPRIAELINSQSKIQDSSQEIHQSLSGLRYIPWIRDMSNVIATQDEYFVLMCKVLMPGHVFAIAHGEIHGLLNKLDSDFIAWDTAIKENAGKGISAFLDAADSIIDTMQKDLDILVLTRNKQIQNKSHQAPTDLDESCQLLQKKNIEIDSMLKKITAPAASDQEIYQRLWDFANTKQSLNVDRLKKDIAFLQQISTENLGETIRNYKQQVEKIARVFNELVDVEQGVEVQLEELTQATTATALREARKTQFATMPSLDIPTQESGIASIIKLCEAEKNSPPSSPSLSRSRSVTPSSSAGSSPDNSSMLKDKATSSVDIFSLGGNEVETKEKNRPVVSPNISAASSSSYMHSVLRSSTSVSTPSILTKQAIPCVMPVSNESSFQSISDGKMNSEPKLPSIQKNQNEQSPYVQLSCLNSSNSPISGGGIKQTDPRELHRFDTPTAHS